MSRMEHLSRVDGLAGDVAMRSSLGSIMESERVCCWVMAGCWNGML